jgi:rubrerythrin
VTAVPSQPSQPLKLRLSTLTDRRRRELTAQVTSDYVGEMRCTQVLTDLARRLRNPQLRAAIAGVAEVERRHAARLAEILQNLGGTIPADPPPVTGTPWALLMHAYEVEGADYYRYVDRQYVDDIEYLREIYAQLAEEEKQNKRIIRDVAQRVDPASLGGMTTWP